MDSISGSFGIYFTKKRRVETLQPGLEFGNFNLRLKSGIYKCICPIKPVNLGKYQELSVEGCQQRTLESSG
jgi:hypothetical protein